MTDQLDNVIRVTAHYNAHFDLGMVDRQYEGATGQRADRRVIAERIAVLAGDGELRWTPQGWVKVQRGAEVAK